MVVFCVVIAAMAVATVVLWNDVAEVLPGVGKDKQGEDPWVDPIGVEKVGPYTVAHIPDCAAAPVVRIGLWDEDSTPYWEVSGPPTPMETFAVGGLPEGFTEETPYRDPPRGSVLRLVVIRSVKGVAGVRYEATDLRSGYVATGNPIVRYSIDGFKTGSVCGDGEGDSGDGGDTTSTTGG